MSSTNWLKKDLEVVEGLSNLPTMARKNGDLDESYLDAVVRILDIKTQAGREAVKVALANCRLLDRKQQDYGPDNIADFADYGVVVRLNDKMKRLKHIYNKPRRKAVNESIDDSFRDVGNYGVIAILVRLGLWPDHE